MTKRTSPPFRADHVGSLLRPANLLGARKEFADGTIDADALREVARLVPDDRLLIETDSPFLAPVPQRGCRNQPAFIIHVAERLASLRGTSTAKIAELTTRNAEKLFGSWSLPA